MSCAVTGARGAVDWAASTAAPAKTTSSVIVNRARTRLLLLPHGRIESSQCLQVADQMVEVAGARSVETEHGHRRLGRVHHRLHLVFLVALDAVARTHDLDREQILVLLAAPDRRARLRREGHRLVPG